MIYLPCYFHEDKMIPANDPVMVAANGSITYLKPDTGKVHREMIVSQMNRQLFHTSSMINGCFQGADAADFSDAVDLLTLTKMPDQGLNARQINPGRTFKYLRYLSPPDQYCRIGELAFFSKDKKVRGRIIGGEECQQDNAKSFSLTKAMDDSLSTFFRSKNPSGDWVGLELKQPVLISEIQFSAEFSNYSNPPVKDHVYELFYWSNAQWVPCGEAMAINDKLTFSNVPSNALYILRDKTSKNKTPLFTYNDRAVQFW